MGRGLVGHEVEPLAGGRPCRLDLGRVADERDRHGLAVRGGLPCPGQRLHRVVGEPVHVADLEPSTRPGLVDLDGQADALVHGHGQGLGSAHPAQAGGQRDRPAQRPAEVLAGRLGERLVGPLQDALGPDVDPRPRGHLAVHHQPGPLELTEVLPGRPPPDEVRVGDEHPWRPLVGAQDPDRLARLDEQRLVVGQRPQLADDGIERRPVAGRTPRAAIDHQLVRILGDLRVEVVHEHAQGRLLRPAAAGQLGATRGAHGARAGGRHGRQATPSGRRGWRDRRRPGRRPGSR